MSYVDNIQSFSFDQMYSTVVDNWHFRLGDLVLPFCFAFGIYGIVRYNFVISPHITNIIFI